MESLKALYMPCVLVENGVYLGLSLFDVWSINSKIMSLDDSTVFLTAYKTVSCLIIMYNIFASCFRTRKYSPMLVFGVDIVKVVLGICAFFETFSFMFLFGVFFKYIVVLVLRIAEQKYQAKKFIIVKKIVAHLAEPRSITGWKIIDGVLYYSSVLNTVIDFTTKCVDGIFAWWNTPSDMTFDKLFQSISGLDDLIKKIDLPDDLKFVVGLTARFRYTVSCLVWSIFGWNSWVVFCVLLLVETCAAFYNVFLRNEMFIESSSMIMDIRQEAIKFAGNLKKYHWVYNILSIGWNFGWSVNWSLDWIFVKPKVV